MTVVIHAAKDGLPTGDTTPLPASRLYTAIGAMKADNNLTREDFRSRLSLLGAPEDQVAFLLNAIDQVAGNKQMSEIARIRDKDRLREAKLVLAERLNQMVYYLAALNPIERAEAVNISDFMIGRDNQWEGLKRGLIGTLGAAYLIATVQPQAELRLPTPVQDVDNGIDLFVGGIPVQIKVSRGADGITVYKSANQFARDATRKISGIGGNNPSDKKYADRLAQQVLGAMSLEKYAKENGCKYALVVIPPDAFNPVTGDPLEKYDLRELRTLFT